MALDKNTITGKNIKHIGICSCGCGNKFYSTDRKKRTKYIRGHHKYWLGKKRPEMIGNRRGFVKGNIPWNIGVECSNNIKEKISQSKKGIHIWGGKRGYMQWIEGENNKLWRGDMVGYIALHSWVRRKLGRPIKCDICKSKNVKRYEWSNISGEYHRDTSDWQQLCSKCHRWYDIKNIRGRSIAKYPERKYANL